MTKSLIIGAVEWTRLLRNLADISDASSVLLSLDGDVIARAGSNTRFDRGAKPAREPSVDPLPNNQARLCIPVRIGIARVGTLYHGPFDMAAGDSAASRRLERKAQGLARLITDQVLDLTLTAAISDLRHAIINIPNSEDLWPNIRDAFQDLVNVRDVRMFTVSPSRDCYVQVLPDVSTWSEQGELPTIPSKQSSVVQRRNGEVFIKCEFNGRLYMVLHMPKADKLTKEDRKRLEKLSVVVAEALLERRRDRANKAVEEIDNALSTECDADLTTSHDHRLKMILGKLMELVDADRGVVVLTDPTSKRHYKVVARTGVPEELESDLPSRVSRDRGNYRRLEKDRKVIVVSDAARDEGFTNLYDTIDECYGSPKTRNAFREHLSGVKSYVKLPLMIGTRVVGALCLSSRDDRVINLGMVHVVEMVAARGFNDVAYFLVSDALTLRSDELTSQADQMVNQRSNNAGKLHLEARLKTLADNAMELCRADRAAVCNVVRGDRISIAVTTGKWPEDHGLGREFQLSSRSTVAQTIRDKRTYRLDDVRSPNDDVEYYKISDETRSTVSVPLCTASRVTGVLHLEWNQANACDTPSVIALEHLARHSADALLPIAWHELEDALNTLDYNALARVVTDSLGAKCGAVFIRNYETGAFHLEGHTADNHVESHRGKSYLPGEGLTGWVAKEVKELCLCDTTDKEELSEFGAVASGKIPDVDEGTEPIRWLGIPITIDGSEVFGVIRFTKPGGQPYSELDIYIAQAAASRIAQTLALRAKERRNAATLELTKKLHVSDHQNIEDFASAVFDALKTGLGDCDAHIRLLDQVPTERGGYEDVMVRVAVSQDNRVILDRAANYFRRRNESVAGEVWNSSETWWDDDVQNKDSKTRPLCSKDYLPYLGSMVVAPLLGSDGIDGMLHVYRSHAHSFCRADKKFIEDISAIALPGMLRIRQHQVDSLKSAFAELASTFLSEVFLGADVETASEDFKLQTLRTLLTGLNAREGFLVSDGIDGLETVYQDMDGETSYQCEDNMMKTLVEWMGGRRYRVAFFRDDFPEEMRNLVDSVETDDIEFGPMICFGIPDENESELDSCLVFLFSPSDVISNTDTRDLHQSIDALGKNLVVARAYESAQIAQPMADQGALFTMLEHRIRAPLLAISHLLNEILRDGVSADEMRELANASKECIEDWDNIRKTLNTDWNFRAYTRDDRIDFDVREAITEAREGLSSEPGFLHVEWNPGKDDVYVHGHKRMLAKTIDALVRNAIDAVSGINREPKISVRLYAAGTLCRLVVKDNGRGMEPEVRRNIFRRFTTGSSLGKTGLGLSAVHAVIRSHGGRVRVQTQPGEGSEFHITVPMTLGVTNG